MVSPSLPPLGLQLEELGAVLRSVIGPMEAHVVAEFQQVIKWVALRRGDVLFRQGDPGDAWFIITSGRLEIEIKNAQGQSNVIGQMGRGESLGEIALLTGDTRTATLYAIREARLARIDKADFDEIMLRHPEVLMSVSRTLSRTLVRRTAGAPPKAKHERLSIAVISATPSAPKAWFAERLARSLAEHGTALYVSREKLIALGIVPNMDSIDENHRSWQELATWLEQKETEHDFIVLEADAEDSAWTLQTLRHSDRTLILGDASAGAAASALERTLFERGRDKRMGSHISLVLVHPPTVHVPRGTARWLDARPFVQRHHHVMHGRDADVERIARMIAGRAIGLTLGGGGARGFAHMGVIKAMQELALPIDYIGGTSMGSIMAGQYAMGITMEEGFELNARIAAEQPFKEYTLPLFAVMRSNKIDKSARMSFADVDIEDLWTPFFCISANLTKAEMVIHERGPLWRATRASGSLPGIAVPVVEGTSLLVDGGVINNLPGDIMRKRCNGAVIAVDVSPEEDVSIGEAQFPSPWALLLSKARRNHRHIPSINDILMRTLMLGSASRTHQVMREVDLYVRPPIDRFGMLEFESMRKISDAGYTHARKVLPAWLETWRASARGANPRGLRRAEDQ
jgi:predicted acylesterase/phospholipase RssA